MLGNWRIRANAPGDSLSVFISVQHPELGDYFVATLKAKRISLSLGSDHGLFFWLMPHKVAFWIYWQVSGIECNIDWSLDLSSIIFLVNLLISSIIKTVSGNCMSILL